ncbi:MAG: glycosyltransferase family 4 protein [Elusimicrobia bacterium]|nr:glycosyltransferase family 4 protein [Elusimicrobiota bacterium]
MLASPAGGGSRQPPRCSPPRRGGERLRIALALPSVQDPAHARVARALSAGLSDLGHDVAVFPPRDGLRPAEARRRLERLLAGGIDVCHIQFFSRGFGYLEKARLPEGVRVVLTHQGASLELVEHPKAFGRLARRADAVTAVSAAGLRELVDSLPETRPKSFVIPNGVDAPARGPWACRPRPRRPFALCVGRLAAYKGTDLLLLAFADLASRGSSLDLAVCGPDQTRGRTRRFADRLGLGRQARLLGARGPAEVGRLMEECLFFVLPSRQENLPMALLEAMARGKAVIASAVGGVAEAVEHGVSGLLVEPGDTRGLTRAMARLAADPGLRARLGKGALEKARRFGWASVAASYSRLYDSLPARGAP